MSIFKDSFHQSIRDQIDVRQIAINTRTPQNLQYFNSRNAWIRLSSSVNVYKGPAFPTPEDLQNEDNYDNSLANKYVLQGGLLNDGKFRAGVGNFSNAYSNVGSDGEPYRLGIRPMPGITGVEIKSKGAYGSLRQATVNFQCWDIKQLEDLELLYMRPGYTLLLEWGWSPYLDNKGNLVTSLDYTDIINTEWTKENLFKRQYARATDGKYKDEKGNDINIIGYQGNADSMFGFVKNYSWKARMDGGYDCSTEIVSMGEVIESLKVNYSPLDTKIDLAKTGLISQNTTLPNGDLAKTILMPQLTSSYAQNILAGVFYEMWELGRQAAGGTTGADEEGHSYQLIDKDKNSVYDLFRITFNIEGGENEAGGTGQIGKSDEQIYITLETLCSLLNNYVLLRDKKASDQNEGKSRPFAPLSVLEADADPTTTNISGSGYLLALAHPLQVSIDPTVCVLKNNLWANGIKISLTAPTTIDPKSGNSIIKFNSNIPDVSGFVETIIRNTIPVDEINNKEALAKYIKDTIQGPEDARYNTNQIKENIKEVTRVFNEKYDTYKIGPPTKSASFELKFDATSTTGKRVGKTLKEVLPSTNTFLDLLDDAAGANLPRNVINDIFGGATNTQNIADSDPEADARKKIEEENKKLEKAAKEGAAGYKFLKNLNMPYFVNDDWKTELGIIGHIYVNLNMLYNLSTSDALASQDKKEKNEIAIYDFVKSILSKISSAIGEVNNFDIFIDPNTNVARIIDINYVDRKSATEAYDTAFQLEVHNLDSVVRSYSLESKIFQEQAAIVAIGAQVGGGALGVDTTSLVAFNRSIRDRIIPIKDAPTSPPIDENPQLRLENLTKSLSTLYSFGADLKSGWFTDGKFNVDEVSKYQNALKDLISFFKELGKTKTKNKAILPTILSLDIDGIGGMIIGNLFKINSDILPKGYKTEDNGIGSKLGYIVTGLGHSINNNDWITKIEAQTIILDEPQGIDIPFENLTISQPEDSVSIDIPTNAALTEALKPVNISNDIKRNLDEIEKACQAQGLTNRFIINAIKGNVMKECGGVAKNENVAAYAKTSNVRIRKIFGTRFASVSDAQLDTIKKNAVEFCEYIYGLKSGKTGKSLGNNQPGDGYKFRGRGYIGITGKDLYTRCGKALGKDFTNNPDSLNTPENAAASTVWYIKEALKVLAPRSDYKLDPRNPQPKNQLEANRLITNCVGGIGLKLTRPAQSAIFNEILAKVDRYANQFSNQA